MFMEGSFSHRRSACAVQTKYDAPHLLEVDYIKDLLFSQQCICEMKLTANGSYRVLLLS